MVFLQAFAPLILRICPSSYFFASSTFLSVIKVIFPLYLQDNDGQTPLHYAVMCEREAIAEYLVKQNADRDLKDNEDSSPSDLCEANWPWMQCAGKQID